MTKSLVRRKSQPIQTSHLRRYESGKVTRVNPGHIRPVVPAHRQILPRRWERHTPLQPASMPSKELKLAPKIRVENHNISLDEFKRRFTSNPKMQDNILEFITDNKEEAIEYFWEEWKNSELNWDAFIQEVEDWGWEGLNDYFGGADNVRTGSHGTHGKISDLKTKEIFDLAVENDELNYWVDHFRSELMERTKSGILQGHTPRFKTILSIDHAAYIEDLEDDDEPSIDGKARQLIKDLDKEKIPFIMLSARYDAAIIVPKEFYSQAIKLKKRQ